MSLRLVERGVVNKEYRGYECRCRNTPILRSELLGKDRW